MILGAHLAFTILVKPQDWYSRKFTSQNRCCKTLYIFHENFKNILNIVLPYVFVACLAVYRVLVVA